MNEGFTDGNMTPQYDGSPYNSGGGKGMAIASMVLGIVSIVLSCSWYIGLISGILAIILGIVYNKKNMRSGMATAGIVCGILGIIFTIVIILVAASLATALGLSALDIYS